MPLGCGLPQLGQSGGIIQGSERRQEFWNYPGTGIGPELDLRECPADLGPRSNILCTEEIAAHMNPEAGRNPGQHTDQSFNEPLSVLSQFEVALTETVT